MRIIRMENRQANVWRKVAVLSAIALLGATQMRADWTFRTYESWGAWGHCPAITDSESGVVFMVEELPDDTLRVICMVHNPGYMFDLDFSTDIFDDNGEKQYTIVAIGEPVGSENIFSTSTFINPNVLSLILPDTLTEIYPFAFDAAYIEGDLVIPGSVTNIGASAFLENRFGDITVGAGVQNIGDYAFGYNVNGYQSVTFLGGYPSGVTSSSDIYGAWNSTATYVLNANLQSWLDSGELTSWNPLTGSGTWQGYPFYCWDYPAPPSFAWYWDGVTYPSTPMITNALGWKFSVTVIDTVGGIDQIRVDEVCGFPPSGSGILDFSGSIVAVDTGTQYKIVSFGVGGGRVFPTSQPGVILGLILPDTVTLIDTSAFSLACAEGNLVIPDSVTHIEDFAFYLNYFSSVEIPASVTYIGESAFGYAEYSHSGGGPMEVTFLGDYPSSGCGDIYGGSWASMAHTYIQFAHLQNWLDSGQVSNWDPATGTGEFCGFPLTCLDYVPPSPSDSDWHFTVTVPGNSTDCAVTNAAGWVFRAWFDYLPDGGPVCVRIYQCIEAPAVPGVLDFSGARIDDDSGGTFLFEQFGDGLTSIFYNGISYDDDKVTGLVLPDQDPVTEPYKIGNGAFANCQYITGDLAIPDAVITIADGAFGNCPFGGTLSFGTSASALTLVEGNAFGSCTFEGVSSWGSLDTIFDWMFAGTTFTTNTFVIPAQITAIGESAFESTIFGADVIVGDGVTDFGDHAFAYSWFQRMSLPSTDVSFGFRTFAWTDMYGDDPEFYYRGAFPDVTNNLLYNSEPTYRTAVSYVTGEWVEDWNAHDIDTYLNGVNTHNGNIQSGNARWLSRAIYCGEWDVSAYLGGGDTPGESETWVHVDVIRVSAGGDVDLEWAFADVETRLGTTTGYRYVIEVCTDLTLMNWVSCVSADLTRLGGMERHRLTNGAMPGSDHRFFKVKAVKN